MAARRRQRAQPNAVATPKAAARAAERPEQVGRAPRRSRRRARPRARPPRRAAGRTSARACRPRTPSPPPSSQAGDPDLGPAAGRDRAPWRRVRRRPPSRTPAPTSPPSRRRPPTPSIGATSISTPPVDERPAKQCPPLRGRERPAAAASASASATSAAVAQRATAAGRASSKRASAGRRAASSASDPGRSTSMRSMLGPGSRRRFGPGVHSRRSCLESPARPTRASPGCRSSIERCELRPLVRDTSSGFTKVSIVVRLTGGVHDGEGEDITWDQIDQIEFLRGGGDLAWLRGTRTFDEFSTLLGLANLFPVAPIRDSARFYRRWAFESAALDLALRQNGLSLQDAVGRPAAAGQLRGVGPDRRPAEPRSRSRRGSASDPGLRFKLDPTPGWDDDARRRARAPGLRRRHRHEGPLPQRHRGDGRRARPVPPRDRGAARRVDRGPGARADDTADLLERHRDRITWDEPIHSIADIEAPAVATAHAQPQARPLRQRAGPVRHLRLLRGARHRRLRRRDVRAGPGRGQLQYLASLFHPDAPNDIAPAGYNLAVAAARPAALAAGARAAPDRLPLGDLRRRAARIREPVGGATALCRLAPWSPSARCC